MLNHDNGVNPLQSISDGYKERGTSKPNEVYDEISALRKMYENDPSSLNGVQLLTLGMAELNAKNVKQSEDRRIDEDKDAQKDDKGGEKDSEDKDKANELESLKTEMAALTKKFEAMNGGANE
ncbi:UNVERIFIED_ORG: hypothetical protein QFZ59_004692 [Bacillus sp. B2I3]|nr:hypothetical protein [Bacillus sp. B2I3]